MREVIPKLTVNFPAFSLCTGGTGAPAKGTDANLKK